MRLFIRRYLKKLDNNAMLNFMKLIMVTKVSVATHGSTYIHLHVHGLHPLTYIDG